MVVSALFYACGVRGVCEKTLAFGNSVNRGNGSSLR